MRLFLAFLLASFFLPFPTKAQDKPIFQLSPKIQLTDLNLEPTNYDVLGIKIGATLEEVTKLLKEQGYSVNLDRERTVSVYLKKGAYKGSYDSQPQIDELKATIDKSGNVDFDYIKCWFTSQLTGSRLYLIQRNIFFEDGKGPEYASTVKSLNGKYGTDLEEDSDYSGSVNVSENGISRIAGGYAGNDMNTNVHNLTYEGDKLDWLVSNIVRKEENTISHVDMIVTNIYGAKLYIKDKSEVQKLKEEFSEKYEAVPETASNYGEIPKL